MVGGLKFESVFFCRDDFEIFLCSNPLNIISGEAAREDRSQNHRSQWIWGAFPDKCLDLPLWLSIGNYVYFDSNHWIFQYFLKRSALICLQIDIFRCGLLWRPLLILYSKDFKTKMFQNHLCKKKQKRLTICGAVELYWGGSSYGKLARFWSPKRLLANISLTKH